MSHEEYRSGCGCIVCVRLQLASALEREERLTAEVARLRGVVAGWESQVLVVGKQLDDASETVQREIGGLADVLTSDFGGPTQSESACEMAVRVLREQRARIAALEERCRAEIRFEDCADSVVGQMYAARAAARAAAPVGDERP